jgi:hypothetical protein
LINRNNNVKNKEEFMIRKVEMYQAVCDNCGKACINEDICAWSEESQAIEDALYMDWQIIGDRLYCPDCFEYDDETDEYKPINKEK